MSTNTARLQGGHLAGHFRETFSNALEAVCRRRGRAPFPKIEFDGRKISVADACGLVWNCTDALPSADASMIEMLTDRRAGSYAAAARRLKKVIAGA